VATNTGDGFRRGSIKDRTQFQREDGNFQKRGDDGRFREMKDDGTKFKGVATEPDGRDGKD
jgi:hypothetical protein